MFYEDSNTQQCRSHQYGRQQSVMLFFVMMFMMVFAGATLMMMMMFMCHIFLSFLFHAAKVWKSFCNSVANLQTGLTLYI